MNSENANKNNIICPKCGATNMINTNFCIKCGNFMQNSEETSKVSPNIEKNEQSINYGINSVSNNVQNINTGNLTQMQNIQANQNIQKIQNIKNMNYFSYIVKVIVKPFHEFNKSEKELSIFKNSFILSLIITIFLTITNLFTTMFHAVRETSYYSHKVEWVWENLKEIEYLKVVGLSLLIYMGIILGIAAIYYLASLVIKKEVKYSKLVGIVATSFLPISIGLSLLSPILSLLHPTIGTIINVISFIYTLIILIELTNDVILIEDKNTRIYFQTICLSIIILVLSFIIYKLILGSISNSLGSLSSTLG